MKPVRIFFTGAATGLLIGVFLSPILTRDDFAGGAIGEAINGMAARIQPIPPVTEWPTGEQALAALFTFSNWPAVAQADTSSVKVNECLRRAEDMVCHLTLNLSWIDAPQNVEADFRSKLGHWSILSLKEIRSKISHPLRPSLRRCLICAFRPPQGQRHEHERGGTEISFG